MNINNIFIQKRFNFICSKINNSFHLRILHIQFLPILKGIDKGYISLKATVYSLSIANKFIIKTHTLNFFVLLLLYNSSHVLCCMQSTPSTYSRKNIHFFFQILVHHHSSTLFRNIDRRTTFNDARTWRDVKCSRAISGRPFAFTRAIKKTRLGVSKQWGATRRRYA